MTINPNDIHQMAEFGKQMYEALPDEVKENILIPSSLSLGKTGKSFFDILGFPFNALAIKANAHLELLEHRTNEKIELLKSQEKYTEVKVGMAVKAIEQSKYSLESETLRECFANLISNSLNTDTVSKITPNFATILGSFSESDALFLKNIISEKDFINGFATADIRIEDDKNNGYEPFKDLVILNSDIAVDYSKEISTMISFGIFTRWNKLTSGEDEVKYRKIENSHQFANLKKIIDNKEMGDYTSIYLRKHSVILTSLGREFISTVIV